MDKPRIYTAKELGEILKVSPKTIYRAGQSGQIPSYKVGKSVRFEMPKERIFEDKTAQDITSLTHAYDEARGTKQ